MTRFGSWLRGELQRLRGFSEGSARSERFDDEARFHLEMLMERHIRQGASAAEARRRALLEFGGVDRFREAARDEYRSRPLEELWRDVRLAVRNLARIPAFTGAAVLTLALGVGATTVVYSIVDHVVLRPLPYHDADRLVVVREVIEEIRADIPSLGARAAHYLEWRQSCEVCDDVAALLPERAVLHTGDEPLRVRGVRVSANLFPLLGTHAELGRLFLAEEDTPERSGVVVVSHGFWQRHLAGDPAAVGRTLRIDATDREVIGVLPARFRLPKGDELGPNVSMHAEPDYYVPLAFTEAQVSAGGSWDYVALARLSRGVTVSQATEHFNGMQRSLAAALPQAVGMSALVLPLREQVVGGAGRGLLLLLGAVGAVLLLVCVNLANLLLARNASRTHESAVRAALGAGRMRLVREAMTESLVLAMVAGVLGVLLSWWGLQLLLQIAPPDMPRLHEVRLDARVAGVAMLMALITGIFFGALPALRSANADPAGVLKAGAGRTRGGRAETRSRAVLIGAQCAMAAVLLVVAGLFLTSFVRVLGIDKGFSSARVLAFDVTIPRAEYENVAQLNRIFASVVQELTATPGLEDAAVTSTLPLEGITWLDSFREEGAPDGERGASANFHRVTEQYFSTLRIPIRSGRAFTSGEQGRDVVVLSEAAARALWPNEATSAAVGRRVSMGRHFVGEVIGISADVTATGLEAEAAPIIYVPQWTEIGFPNSAAVVVRSAADATQSIASARTAIRRAAPGAVISGERTLDELVANAAAERRFQMSLLVLFAITALVTACIGIYGVIAHSLARRRGEIGLRMALGARRMTIHLQVIREGLGAALLGIAVGLAMIVAAGRVIGSLLYEVRPTEPGVLLMVTALLATVALLAAYVPARRATATDPSSVLRQE